MLTFLVQLRYSWIGTLRRLASEVGFFVKINGFSAVRGRNRYNFKTAKGKSLKFRTYMVYVMIYLYANFGGSRSRDTGFQPKKLKKTFRDLNRYSSKTNCGRKNLQSLGDRPFGRAVTRSSLARKDRDSNLGPVKSNSILATIRHRCTISSKGAVLFRCNDAEMGPSNSLRGIGVIQRI